ncbi:ChuX/HutX family heme-like substrate-binding protein [Aquincola sp. MAHUQ-54]|uniref:ChuX/HutX family heme-like substrate-binding protein n=1 Tax=Aquincola agrisoli TaxID=3119538 RepID=A0AAW9QLK1_9BURK
MATEPSRAALRVRFAEARAGGLRPKDAAESLGLSEGAAIAAHVPGAGEDLPAAGLRAVRLRGPWIDLLRSLEDCGPLMALTRNASVVHEKTGVYQGLSAQGPVGLAVGEDIDLRIFFHHWACGFAVHEPAREGPAGPQPSLQFFDANGTAVHKIYPRGQTDAARWQQVAADFADTTSPPPRFVPAEAPVPPRPDDTIDVEAFGQAWAGMHDTHEFFGLLRQHGVERQQGLELMEGRFTQRVPAASVRTLLQAAATGGTPVMVFVGNPGCIQIHTGPVRRIEPMGPWLNVLDPGFNLHLREDHIAGAWVVEKPTDAGTVTSLEVFDSARRLIVQFFGARQPGQAEQPAWRALVAPLRQPA